MLLHDHHPPINGVETAELQATPISLPKDFAKRFPILATHWPLSRVDVCDEASEAA